MTLFCKPVCWFCGLLVRRIDLQMGKIHADYHVDEKELRERDRRASMPSMGRAHGKRSRSNEQIRQHQTELTLQHRKLQSKRTAVNAVRGKFGNPVPLMVAVL